MRFLLLSLLLANAGLSSPMQAQAPVPAARLTRIASDTARVGAYDLELTTDNGTLTGELTVGRTSGKLTANIRVGGHSPDVKSFKHDESGYTIEAATSSFTVTYKLKFANDSLRGAFSMSTGLAGTVIGARKP